MAFNKDILGVTPARLLSPQGVQYASFSSPLKVHKKPGSLFWALGEPIFNILRDAFTNSANMAWEDLQLRELEAELLGPLGKMDQKLAEVVNVPRKKYKTQTTDYEIPEVLNKIPVIGAMT